MDRLKVLCEKGYFPKELPSAFTSTTFGQNVRKTLIDWAGSGTIPQSYSSKNPKWYKVTATEPEAFPLPKGNHERRVMHITHPVPQALLSYVISKNWKTISSWLARAKYSFDKTDIVENSDRAVPDPAFLKHQVHKELIECYANWIIRSDISRFYPSIYTHSIPWAAYGKEKVKKNIQGFKNKLGDQLDTLLRKCNRDQTVGIPIGPDTSRIVADVLSAYVDCEVFVATGLEKEEADRLQDDWLIGCSSLEQAEFRLSKIQSTYQTLGLDINGSKTSIEHLNDIRHPPWRGRIRSYLSGSARRRLVGPDLYDFCRTALSLQSEEPKEFILKYVMSALFNLEIRNQDIPIVESFLLKAVIVDPRVTSDVCQLLLNYSFENRPINIKRICSRFVPFVELALDRGQSYEACWGLYLLRGLKVPITSEKIRDSAAEYDGAVVPLILLDIEERGNITKLPKSRWTKRIEQSRRNGFTDCMWLLAYEGVRHSWLNDPGDKIKSNQLFKPLFSRSIVFYDEKRNVLTRRAILNRKKQHRVNLRKMVFAFLAGY